MGCVLDRIELQKLTDDALDYLKTAKVFEYTGPIRLPGVAFKMVNINMDLDDLVKDLIGKRSSIEFEGTISLIIEKVKEDETKA